MSPAPDRRYDGETAAERDGRRRLALVESGLEAFGTVGYAATTVAGVCRQASVSTRHYYQLFSDREALLVAVFDHVVTEVRTAVVAALADAPDEPFARAHLAFEAYVHGLLDDPRRARVQCIEMVGVSPALESHRRAVLYLYQDVIAAELDAYVDRGLIARRDWRDAALLVVGGVNELMVDHILRDPTPDVDRIVDESVRSLFAIGGLLDQYEAGPTPTPEHP